MIDRDRAVHILVLSLSALSGCFSASANDAGAGADAGQLDAPQSEAAILDAPTPDRSDAGQPILDAPLTDTVQPDRGFIDAPVTDSVQPDHPSLDAPLADRPGDQGGAAVCSGNPFECIQGVAGGACSDAITRSICAGGRWQCANGQIPVSECACVGRPPGDCTCGPVGWQCATDAGTNLSCSPASVNCRMLPPMCRSGEVPSVVGTCWGPCVSFDACAPIACTAENSSTVCPMNTVCHNTTRRCGPFL